MDDTTFLLIIVLIFIGSAASLPLHRKFRENRAKEQKKPEKYHLT
jgi:predicted RND superfamily exporter protein